MKFAIFVVLFAVIVGFIAVEGVKVDERMLRKQREVVPGVWGQHLNKDATEVKKAIESEKPGLKVQILKKGTPVTKDYHADRVRLFVDEDNKVIQVPHIG